jgi:hypothetical protein
MDEEIRTQDPEAAGRAPDHDDSHAAAGRLAAGNHRGLRERGPDDLFPLRARQPESRQPGPADVAIFRLTPAVISVLDYSKGFEHADLVTC